MDYNEQPYISASRSLPEITIKVIILSVILAALLATANAYLALKIGLLTSASIPAAVLSMAILRLFKRANILENNLVQTAASAGEAVAGGIVYTIPALIIIRYWAHFSYWENFAIALIGGLLGVFFSIPLRRILVTEKALRFPEGKAIAEVLKATENEGGYYRYLLRGGFVGALLELMQLGFKVLASGWQAWFYMKRTLFGFGLGFSAAMVGAGYLIGFAMSLSIMIGAVIGWLLSIPIFSHLYPSLLTGDQPAQMAVTLWETKNRYVGIGAMLVAGVWTFLTLMKPFYHNLKKSFQSTKLSLQLESTLRTEYDIPMTYVFFGITMITLGMYFLFHHLLPIADLDLSLISDHALVFSSLFYVLIIGFIFCAITAYFSGMVGVTASPGSAIIIGGMLLAALLLFVLLQYDVGKILDQDQLLAAEAITIIIGAVITGAAAISNDNIQDLKVGHLLGATPWKQQIMLMLGVVVSALVIPPIMQLLFDVYGIAGVLPHEGMDPTQTLPAPPAAVMAAITQAVFHQNLPWNMLGIGALIIISTIIINHFLKPRGISLSILGIAIGMYLPLASSTPIFIGGVMALIVSRGLMRSEDPEARQKLGYRGTLLACGLLAGAALMDVFLAVPFSLARSPDALSLVSVGWEKMAAVLSMVTIIGLGAWIYRTVCHD